ncbi:MAG: glycosyltransferase [Lachnospiraceae bacterium]|nr:glycosyltransferase [Lachnospiraceae bacterium]
MDYIRNVQELSIIKSYAKSVTTIGSYKMNYLCRLIYVFFKLLFINTKNFDIIFVGFAPQLVIPIFHRKLRKKYIIEDFFISLYDTCCFDRKYFEPTSRTGNFLYDLDKKTIASADFIISDTNAHKDYFVTEFHVNDSEKIHTLYLEADFSLIESTNDALIKKGPVPYESTDSQYHVLYFGSILPLQGVNIILNAINILKYDKNIRFTIIGPLPKSIRLSAPRRDNITYINWLSNDELYEYIRSADLCLAGHFSSDIAKASRTIPGKAYIYQALNKPMILGDNSANHEIFTSTEPNIFFVPMGNHIELAKLIHSIYLKEKSQS